MLDNETLSLDQRYQAASSLMQFVTRPRRRLATIEESLALSGAARHEIRYNGIDLVGWSWGQGPFVLLAHGWESRGSHMTAFVPKLVDAGFCAFALDAPAHGESGGEVTDVIDYGMAVAAAGRYLGSVAGVIAHSVGSAAALHAYAHGLSVNASVQISGPASLLRVLERGGRMAGFDAETTAILRRMMARHLGCDLEVMDLDRLKSGMRHQVLILHDPEDGEVPVEESRALASVWSGSILLELKQLGHRKIVRDEGVAKMAADFIANACREGQL